MGDNVLKFPKNTNRDFELPRTLEEAKEDLEETRRLYANEVANEAFEYVIDLLQSYKFLINPDKIYPKDLMLIDEAIRSCIYRYSGVDHIFHETELVENVFVDEDEVLENIEKLMSEITDDSDEDDTTE